MDKNAEKKQVIVDYYAKTPIYKYAAMAGGITDDTLKAWRDTDSDFSDKLNLARAQWIAKTVPKAKAEFLLERLDREIFGQKLDVTIEDNPIRVLLDAYGIKEGESDDRKIDESIQGSSSSKA